MGVSHRVKSQAFGLRQLMAGVPATCNWRPLCTSISVLVNWKKNKLCPFPQRGTTFYLTFKFIEDQIYTSLIHLFNNSLPKITYVADTVPNWGVPWGAKPHLFSDLMETTHKRWGFKNSVMSLSNLNECKSPEKKINKLY